MTVDVNKIFAFLESLYGLPKAPLVFIFCLAVGWVYKRLSWVPNGAIPLLVALSGAVALPLISDFQNSAIQSARAFYTLNVIIGFIAGALSAATYRWLIKPLLNKLRVKDEETAPPFPPSSTVLMLLSLLPLSLLPLCGCMSLPDTWNYTVSVDHQTGDTTSYAGVSGPITWGRKHTP